MITTRCCVIGGGPAGMMLGLLLARAGVSVVVLEKHADFLHDFRGDMIHPSTLELMHELGLLDELLSLPYRKLTSFVGQIGDQCFPLADFTALPTRCRFLAFMPQWDFLELIRAHAARYPTFQLLMRSEAVGLLDSEERIVGVRAKGAAGMFTVYADLTVCADGRGSQAREWAGLKLEHITTPADVLWMRISRREGDGEPLRRIVSGAIFVTIDRGDYWQCALVIAKNSFSEIQRRGLPEFRRRVASIMPVFQDRLGELARWDDVKLLSVSVNRLQRWHRPGLLCIGDAAHAMSPVLGVGINLAIQDAVAAANILAQPLTSGTLSMGHLRQVQRRRLLPARLMHWLQIFTDRRVIAPVLAARRSPPIPWTLRLLRRFPPLRRALARVIGLGFRNEHVRTPDMFAISKG